MYRIDNASASATKPDYGSAGTESYFQDTNPAGGTVVPAWFVNQVQEELRAVVVGAGGTPSKSNDHQVWDAIVSYVSAQITEKAASLKAQQYAIGDIFITTRSGNPATLLGYGTWVRVAEGMTLVGYKSSDPDFSTIGNTGGEKTHTLTTDEIPSHKHSLSPSVKTFGGAYGLDATGNGAGSPESITETQTSGGGLAHNNMPPYYVVAMWLRIS